LPKREFLNFGVLLENCVRACTNLGGSTNADIDSGGFLHGEVPLLGAIVSTPAATKRPSADEKRLRDRRAADPTREGRETANPIRFVEYFAVFLNCFSRRATLDAWDDNGR
jgi:hypothetical protein